MVTTLTISPEESLSSLESKTALLTSKRRFKVRLPSHLNTRGALGIEVSLIQLIGTWLQQNSFPKIFHSYQEASPEAFHNLCSTIYGIAALSMIDEIWDAQKVKLPRGLVLAEAVKTIDSLTKQNFNDCFVSRYFGVPYIKNPRYDKEFDMPFYNGDEVISSEAFQGLVKKFLKKIF